MNNVGNSENPLVEPTLSDKISKETPPILPEISDQVAKIVPNFLKDSKLTKSLDTQHPEISPPISNAKELDGKDLKLISTFIAKEGSPLHGKGITEIIKINDENNIFSIDLNNFINEKNIKHFHIIVKTPQGELQRVINYENFDPSSKDYQDNFVIIHSKSSTIFKKGNDPINFNNIAHLNLPPHIKQKLKNNQINVITISNQQWGQLTNIIHTVFTEFITQLAMSSNKKTDEKEDEKTTSSATPLNTHRYQYQPVMSSHGKVVQNSVKVPFGVLLEIFQFMETSKSQFTETLREQREQNAKDLKKYRAEDDHKYDINKTEIEKSTIKTTLHKHYEQVIEAMKKAA